MHDRRTHLPTPPIVVDIAHLRVSDDPNAVLATYSLGSCVALVLHDPVARIGGIAHCMLPRAKMAPEKSRERPALYTDEGAQKLLQDVFNRGARRSRLVAKVVGAAQMLDERGVFDIGRRNYTVVRRVLWRNSILIAAEDAGGVVSRTVYLHIGSGRCLEPISVGDRECR
jgi:chemotaxis protein CheD